MRAFTGVGAVLVALMAFWACTVGDGSPPRIRITGRLLDAETGLSISRRTLWIHGFSDDAGAQVSLRGANGSTFELELPTPTVRLRIFDEEKAYELYEQEFTAQNGLLDVTVRLEPTHRIRLHGKVLWRDGERLRSLDEGDGNVRHVKVYVGHDSFSPVRDGSYSIKVPREFLKVDTVDTSRRSTPHEIDLRGTTDDDLELDLILEAN